MERNRITQMPSDQQLQQRANEERAFLKSFA